MATPHASTARWLAAIFHQYSLSVEQWRVLAESKTLERDQYKRVNESLQVQLDETVSCQRALQEVVDAQQKAISSLEYELAQASQSIPPPAHTHMQVSNIIHRPSHLRAPVEPLHPPVQILQHQPGSRELSTAHPHFQQDTSGYSQSTHQSPSGTERPMKKMRTDDYIEVDYESPPATQIVE